MKKVCCVGIVTADVIVKPVDSLPEPGILRNVDALSMHVGGCAANAAVDLARLGVPCRLITKLGEDGFGRFVKGYLEDEGIDTGSVVIDRELSTTASVVCVYSSGERSFLHNPVSNDSITLADIDMKAVEDCDILFVAGTFLMKRFDGADCMALLRKARAMGKFTALDTAWDTRGEWMKKLGCCLPYLDLFMPSYDEAVFLADGERDHAKQADLFHRLGAKNVIVKLGSGGAYVSEEGKEPFLSPAFHMEKPVDTTGAGDSFCAGFLAGLSNGWDFAASARLGNAVGYHCVGKMGASEGVVSLEKTLAFMQNWKK